MSDRFEFQIPPRFNKARLDEFLYAEFPHLGRMYLRELVRDGKCEVNGLVENRGYRLRTNDFIEVVVDRARQTSLQPEPIGLSVLFEDEVILVVDKPSGMLIHPTVRVRSGTLLNAVAHHLNSTDPDEFRRAGLVHRLDKDTSGLVVIAKTHRAHQILARHFQRKLVNKRYIAIADGCIAEDSGIVEAPIGRFAEDRVWNIKSDGKASVSKFKVLARSDKRTLVELEPVTGRTNQLRIHMAHIGHPLTGDRKYGGSDWPRLCLHAWAIGFNHPILGQPVEFEAPVPTDMEFESD